MKRSLTVALLLLAGCFDFNGASNGGPGEPCWPEGDELCDRGLVCAEDGICRKVPPDLRATCTLSSECGDGEACDGGRCTAYAASCSGDANCRPDYFCSSQVCTKKLAVAAACERNEQCASEACTDGVCCSEPCNGSCASCNGVLTAMADGTCAMIPVDTDPRDECFGDLSCDGAGGCGFKSLGDVCGSDNECESTFCSDGVCCNDECGNACQRCDASGSCVTVLSAEDSGQCDDAHRTGACAQVPCACDAIGECKSGGGVGCENTASCSSGQTCVDGVCCDAPCNGVCESCLASRTGSTTGHCAPIPAAADPDSECAGVTTCDGQRRCYARTNGQFCNNAYECSSQHCAIEDHVCCDTDCTTSCAECPSTGANPGRCSPRPLGSECTTTFATGTCTSDGRCVLANGAVCEDSEECISGNCVKQPCPIQQPTCQSRFGLCKP